MAATVIPLPGGGGATVNIDDDVRFWDPYDGTLFASYSAADFANLDALPDNPTHSGMISQGWNWTLADAKTQVAWSGKLDIGQLYSTTDGETKIHVHMVAPALSPTMKIGVKSGTVTVDWGDGTTPNTDSNSGTSFSLKTFTHTYASEGDYVVSVSVTSGGAYQLSGTSYGSRIFTIDSSTIGANGIYNACIRRIELGSAVSLGEYAFMQLYNLSALTLASDTTIAISHNIFNTCAAPVIVIPNGVEALYNSVFQQCGRLKAVSLPASVTSFGTSEFYDCHVLDRVTFPKNTTSIGILAFGNCYSIKFIDLPSAMTTSPGSLGAQAKIEEFEFSSNFTTIGSESCYNWNYLRSVKFHGSVTTIKNTAFSQCYALQEITLPSSLTTIQYDAFNKDYSLARIEIPASVTSIGNQAFRYCYGLREIKFLGSTPPSVGSNAFANIQTSCIIYVPSGSLSAYTGTSNMPSSSSYTYVEY